MNKADTPEQRGTLAEALDDSEAVQGARKAVKELFEGKTMTDIKPEQIDELIGWCEARMMSRLADAEKNRKDAAAERWYLNEANSYRKAAQALRELQSCREENERLREEKRQRRDAVEKWTMDDKYDY